MEWLLLFTFGPMLLACALQTLLLYLTRNHCQFLRWGLLGLLSIPVYGAVSAWLDGGFLWQLGVALFLGMGLSGLIGWGVAWRFFTLRKGKRGKS